MRPCSHYNDLRRRDMLIPRMYRSCGRQALFTRYFHRSERPRSRVFQSRDTIIRARESEWFNPVLEHWVNIRPSETGGRVPIFPKLPKDWGILENIGATAGETHAALTRLQRELGLEPYPKLHSARAWWPTCARKLLYCREGREQLGNWDPGGLMPDRYYRANCAEELRLREGIFGKKSNSEVETRECARSSRAGECS